MMLSITEAAREARARRALARQGLGLSKSRCRVEQSPEWQTYLIFDQATNFVTAGPGLDLDAVEAAVAE